MKLSEAAQYLKDAQINEVDDEDKGKAPPMKAGEPATTKQVADSLGVTASRVRQMALAGELKTDSSGKPPGKKEKGNRQVKFNQKDVQGKKSNMPKKGRPKGAKEGTGPRSKK